MKKLFLKLNFSYLLPFLIYSLFAFAFLIEGCSTKVVEKPIFIEKKCPVLKTYDFNKTYKMTAYKKGNKFFIEEWNATVNKNVVYDLYKYIKILKSQLNKCNEEIKIYNKKFGN